MQAITNPAVDALTEQRRAMAARLGVDSLFAVHRAIDGNWSRLPERAWLSTRSSGA